jgi:hypothetical protein
VVEEWWFTSGEVGLLIGIKQSPAWKVRLLSRIPPKVVDVTFLTDCMKVSTRIALIYVS